MNIEGAQCTILWHVDDLKISHRDESVIKEILCWLEKTYGKIRTTRGKQHTYVGMDLDFSNEGKVEVTMIEYLNETLEDFPEEIVGTGSTPVSLFLFTVNESAEKLNKKDAKVFHTTVAKLLFVTKKARGDTITAISFLSTRVKCPDINDWKNLIRLLKYVKRTIDLKLTLSTDSSNILK